MDPRQGLKKAEATIAYCNTRLSAIESGSKDKDAARNDLQLKLTAAAAAEATSATKWERERQQLRDEIVRARQERDDALASISGGDPDWPGSLRTATGAGRRRT